MTDIYAFAERLATALGEGWTVEPIDPERDWTKNHPTLINRAQGGISFWLRPGWQRSDRDRISVNCNWPKDATGQEQRPYFSTYSENGASEPSISFANSKTPEQAAKDIQRRFLPSFVPLWDAQAERAANSDSYRAARTAVVERAAKLLNGRVFKRNDHDLPSVHLGHREHGIHEVGFDSNNTGVEVKIRCTFAELEQLAAMFADDDEDEGEPEPSVPGDLLAPRNRRTGER